MDQTAPAVPEEQRFILSALSPSLAQRRLALAVMIALILACLITVGPLSTFQPRRIDAFVPIHATAVFVTDFITAVLLFAQFSILRSRGLAVLGSGYLFAGLILIPWMLTFPGVFAPDGLLGAGLYSAQWLYNLRHLGFPMCVIAYALLKDADPTKGLWQGSVAAGILPSVAVTTALVCAATVLVTAGHTLLPHTMLDPVRGSTLRLYIAGCQIGLSVAAFIVLWVRLRSVLDLWLMVVMGAYAIECGRFSRSGPLQHRVVRRPGLQPNLWQSPALCSAVRDHGALWATAARNPRPTARARGAADDRRCGIGFDGSRDQ